MLLLNTSMDPHVQHLQFLETAEVFTGMYPDAEVIRPVLTSKIKEQGDQQYRKTNVKADMTKWTMQNDIHFKKIIDFAIELITNGSNPLPQGEFFATDCWGAVYRQGEETLPHAHHPATWSFVYYVDASPFCAPLVFPTAERAIKPETGLIIIFPGWVSHSVPKQEIDKERIIVSGNIAIKRPQAT